MTRLLTGAVIAALGLSAQAGEPDGAHDGAEWQIWAYSSAAPAPLVPALALPVLPAASAAGTAGTAGAGAVCAIHSDLSLS